MHIADSYLEVLRRLHRQVRFILHFKYYRCFSCRDSSDQLPLHIAASRGFKNNVALLLRENPEHINIVDCSGRSALLLAAQKNFPAMVSYLLSKNADHEVKDQLGLTAFDWALSNNSPGVIGAFLGTKFWKEVEVRHIGIYRTIFAK